MMNNNFFVLYSDCIPVNGSARSLICDLGRNDFIFIETGHYEALSKNTVVVDHENKEWLDYLVEEDYGFYTDTPERFPRLTFNHENSSIITNAIVELNESADHLKKLLEKSEQSRIEALELRIYNRSKEFLVDILSLISSSNIRSVSLCLSDYRTINVDFTMVLSDINTLREQFNELKAVSLFACSENDSFIVQDTLIVYNTTSLRNDHCGRISPKNFIINFQNFAEANNCNSCLNKKMALDTEGNIKPCPSIEKTIGNINDFDLRDIANNTVIQKYNIAKDQIEVCRDCEFRYICHDCRAYLSPEKMNAKPKYCSYDPYTATWQ